MENFSRWNCNCILKMCVNGNEITIIRRKIRKYVAFKDIKQSVTNT